MVHTSWTGQVGAPQDIRALAQTPDGTLWIGSTAGLFSFDGLHFTAFEPKHGDPDFPSTAIRSLFVSKQGDLWIVGSYVGVARLSSGHLTTFGNKNVRLFQIQQDSEGTVWGIRNYRELVRLQADHTWLRVQAPLVHSGYLSTLFIDSSDTQWVSEDGRLYKRSKGRADFQPTGIFTDGETTFTEDDDGIIWIRGEELRLGKSQKPSAVLRMDHEGNVLATSVQWGKVNDLLIPGDGSIWTSGPGQGISRIKLSAPSVRAALHQVGRRESFAFLDGLSSNAVHALLRDVDGNVWAGGLKGLDRFEHATLIPLTKTSQTGNWSTCTNPQGEVWVESDDAPLAVLQHGELHFEHKADGYSKLLCTSNGDVWFLDQFGIGIIHDHQLRQLPLLPRHIGYGTLYSFIAFAKSSDDGLIASVGSATERKLWKYKKGEWSQFAPDIFTGFAQAVFDEGQGRLYLGRTDGEIFVLSDTQPLLVREESSSLGVISAFSRTSYGLFALGAEGIAIERGDSFHNLTFAQPESAKTATGLVESDDGDLWLNGSRGIVRIRSHEVLAAITDTNHAIVSSEWHEGDYIGPAPFNNSTASAAKGSDGQLWFSTLNGVVSLRTEDTRTVARPPQLSIKAIFADDRPLDANNSFPPNPRTLRIRYFGVNLTHPDKVTYKYRLGGVDENWQNVGHRTEATYTRLRPGRYIFQVMASNDAESWDGSVSSFEFRVLPHFWQTWWFDFLLGAVILLTMLALVRIRVRSATRLVQLRSNERLDERIRIARDLHDTLLQGVQGLLLSFHAASQKIADNHEAKKPLDKALQTAEKIIVEGRDRVSNLRLEGVTSQPLEIEILEATEVLQAFYRIPFMINESGRQRPLEPRVQQEVLDIIKEALTNASRHSQATSIDVHLSYMRRQLIVTCVDNGRGFDPNGVGFSDGSMHFGLRGMSERAQEAGGTLRIDSSPRHGTKVELKVPLPLEALRRWWDPFAWWQKGDSNE